MLTPKTMTCFEKDLKKAKKQHKDIESLKIFMKLLTAEKQLEAKCSIILLKGDGRGTEDAI